MHDVGEGVIPYDMSDIILGLIKDSKRFTLDELNIDLEGLILVLWTVEIDLDF